MANWCVKEHCGPKWYGPESERKNTSETVHFIEHEEMTASGRPADLYCDYSFFETEKDAISAYLRSLTDNPQANYRKREKKEAEERLTKLS